MARVNFGTHPVRWDDKVFLSGACRDEFDDTWVDLNLRELNRRNPVLRTEKGEKFILLYVAQFDQR